MHLGTNEDYCNGENWKLGSMIEAVMFGARLSAKLAEFESLLASWGQKMIESLVANLGAHFGVDLAAN